MIELNRIYNEDSFKVLREVAINGCGEADVVIFSRQKNGGFITTAFEAKMNDWRRGLLQAARYRAYANVAILVVPVNTATRALRFLDTFRAVKIGLWSFDEQSKKIYRHYTPNADKAIAQMFLKKFYRYSFNNQSSVLGELFGISQYLCETSPKG